MSKISFYEIPATAEGPLLEQLLRQNLAENGKAMILVPESMTMAYEKAVIHRLKQNGLLNVTVLSPRKLQKKVFAEAGYESIAGKARTHLSDAGITGRIYRQLNDLSEDEQLKFFRESIRMSAAQRVSDCIADLENNGYDTGKLRRLALADDIKPNLHEKLQDLSAVWTGLNGMQGKEEENDRELWSHMCRRIPFCKSLAGTHFYLCGFNFLYARFRELLDILEQTAASVSILLHCPPVPDFDTVHNSVDAYYRHRKKEKDTEDCPVLYRSGDPQSGSNQTDDSVTPQALRMPDCTKETAASIDFLANTVLQPENAAGCTPDFHNIELYTAPSQYIECLHAAQKLLDWHKEGCAWHELGIVINDDAVLNAMLPHVLTSAGIPFFYRIQEPLDLSGCAFFLRHSVRSVTQGFRQADLLAILRSGFSPLTQEEIPALQNYALRFGIDGSRWCMPFLSHSSVPEAETLRMEELRLKLITPLETLKSTLFKNKPTSTDQAAQLWQYLVDCGVYEKLKQEEADYQARGQQKEADFIRQSWENMNRCLNTLATEVFRQCHIPIHLMSPCLELLFSQSSIKFIPQIADAVTVDKSRMLIPGQLKRCILIGMQESVLPPATELLTQSDKIWMTEHNSLVNASPCFDASPVSGDPAGPKQDLYRAILSATEKLDITCALVAQDGSALQKSALFNTVEKILSRSYPANIHGGVLNAELRPICAGVGTELLAEKLRHYRDFGQDSLSPDASGAEDLLWQQLYAQLRNRKDLLLESILHNLNPKPVEKQLPAETAKKLYTEETANISDLEEYAACPYKSFLDNGIGLQEPPEYGFDYTEQGTFFHMAIQAYFNQVMKLPVFPNLSRPQIMQIFNNACAPLIRELFSGPLGDSGLKRLIAHDTVHRVRTTVVRITLAMTESAFRPVGNEVRFGPNERLPEIPLNLSDGRVISLQGTIDRTDCLIGPDGKIWVMPVDYKSSLHRLNQEAIKAGLQLQMLCYLAALNMSRQNAEPAGALYQPVIDPVIDLDDISEGTPEDKLQQQYQMTGILCDDPTVIGAVGKTVRLSKRGNAVLTVSKEELLGITEQAVQQAGRLMESRISGDICVRPTAVEGRSPCTYCSFRHKCCPFDERLPGYIQRIIGK